MGLCIIGEEHDERGGHYIFQSRCCGWSLGNHPKTELAIDRDTQPANTIFCPLASGLAMGTSRRNVMTEQPRWRAHVVAPWHWDGYDFYLARDELMGTVKWMTGFTWTEMPEGSVLSDEMRVLHGSQVCETQHMLQAIVGAAWQAGIRPAQLTEEVSEVTAMRYHLEDLRRLAGFREKKG